MSSADDYNARQLAGARLTASHVTELVRHWQREHNLDADGMAGPRTIASIESKLAARTGPPPPPAPRCFPLRALTDGRQPKVTSAFKTRNPSRPNHNGVDLFYQYKAGDPPMRTGDGGRTSSWWIPDNTPAIACASGTVELAGWSPTGFRVWIYIGDGWRVGYFHLSRLDVRAGDVVELGTPLGIVGDNPNDVDARHLHFEICYGEIELRDVRDPEAFLIGARVLAGGPPPHGLPAPR